MGDFFYTTVIEGEGLSVTIPESAILQAAKRAWEDFASHGSDSMGKNDFASAVLDIFADQLLHKEADIRVKLRLVGEV